MFYTSKGPINYPISMALANWSIMDAGPGGNIIGINFSNNGSAVCRTDTGGCYVNTLANPIWRLLINNSTMPAGESVLLGDYAGTVHANGTYAAAIAPSNDQILYIFTINSKVYVSTNRGLTFSNTGFTQVDIGVNSQHDNAFNEGIAIDPNTPSTVIVGWGNSNGGTGGVQYSTNSGTTWNNITLSTGSTNGTYKALISYKPGSSSIAYAHIYGAGVYQTTTGPAGTWTLLNSSGMPTTVQTMSVDSSGNVYCVTDSNTGSIIIYNGTSWSTVATANGAYGNGDSIRGICCDPNTVGRVLVTSTFGLISESTNHGSTWSFQTPLLSGSQIVGRNTPADVAWVGTTTHNTMASGCSAINPALTNTIQIGDGISSWQHNPFTISSSTSHTLGFGTPNTINFVVSMSQTNFQAPVVGDGINFYSNANPTVNNGAGTVISYTPITGTTGTLSVTSNFEVGSGAHTDWNIRSTPYWTSQGAGINQLNNTRFVVPPVGNPFYTCWDRIGFSLPSATAFPANQAFVGTTPEICAGWDVDYSYNNPSCMAVVANFGGIENSGFSSDGGNTWTKFASSSPVTAGGLGGSIAVACNASSSATAQNIVWLSGEGFNSGNNQPYYSTNSGTTWTIATVPTSGLGAVPTTADCGWGFSYNLSGYSARMLAADRVNLNTFYAINYETNCAYISTNSGATFTTAGTTVVPVNGGSIAGNSYLKTAPKTGSTSTAGWVFMNTTAVASDCFVKSLNGGTSWSTVNTNFSAVAQFGFGASVNGATPALLVAGILSGVRGLFLSTDSTYSSWKNVTGSFNSGDELFDIDGDKNTTGLWYVTSFSTGIYKGINIS